MPRTNNYYVVEEKRIERADYNLVRDYFPAEIKKERDAQRVAVKHANATSRPVRVKYCGSWQRVRGGVQQVDIIVFEASYNKHAGRVLGCEVWKPIAK